MVFLSFLVIQKILRSLHWYLGFSKPGHLELRGKWRKDKSESTLSIQNGDSINKGRIR